MKIVWDEPKREVNLAKHGFDFEQVYDFDWAHALLLPSHSRRYRAIGKLDAKIVTIIFSRLGSEGISIVSFRASSYGERKRYGKR